MLANLKLKNRMFLGYSVPILLFVGLAGLVYSNAARVSRVLSQVELTQQALEIANGMTLNHARMVESARGYLLFQNEELLSEYENGVQLFNEAAEQAASIIQNLDQQQRAKEMIESKIQYEDFSQRLFNLVKEGKTTEAILLFKTGEGKNYIDRFRSVSEEFKVAEKQILENATANARTAIANLLAAVAIGVLLCAVFSTIAGLGISASIAGAIERAVSAIASSSNEISVTIEQQERTAAAQATAVNQTTATMDELGASARQSATQAQNSAGGARQALTLTEVGTQAVGRTLDAQAILKEKVSAIAQQILQLSEQTGQIGNISQLVSDLANQTNMLALNAAVEAVRAGEHGKGFAVVASEIRKLADQSQKSAQKINTLVADIQNAINSTVLVTDEGTQTVEQGMEIARETADAFTGVRDAINEVVVSSQQIALNAQQQVSAIEQVVDAMNSINIAAKETAGGISNTKIGTQQLNDAAQDLQAMI